MKKLIIGALFSSFLTMSGAALADSTPVAPVPLRLGFGMDIGVPSGAAVGVVLHPKLDWLTAEASFTYLVGPGGRLSIKLDPMALILVKHYNADHVATLVPEFPFGIFADIQGGFMAASSIPGHSSDLPSVGWDYVNLYGGLRLGNPNGFHWNFEAGPSYMHIATGNFQSLVNKAGAGNVGGLKVGNPNVDGWVAPTILTGFEVVWDIKK